MKLIRECRVLYNVSNSSGLRNEIFTLPLIFFGKVFIFQTPEQFFHAAECASVLTSSSVSFVWMGVFVSSSFSFFFHPAV